MGEAGETAFGSLEAFHSRDMPTTVSVQLEKIFIKPNSKMSIRMNALDNAQEVQPVVALSGMLRDGRDRNASTYLLALIRIELLRVHLADAGGMLNAIPEVENSRSEIR